MNKRRWLRILILSGGLSILLTAAWIGIVFFCRPAYIAPDTSGWKTGDIFFSVGDSWESVAVRALTGAKSFELSDSTPSHCGLVVRYSGEVRLVHESTVAKKIVVETPEEYLKNNGSYCLYVRKSPCAPDSVILRQTVDSLLSTGIPFDFDFDHSSPQALYCTEMVVRVSEICGSGYFSHLRKKDYIYPEDILKMCFDSVP